MSTQDTALQEALSVLLGAESEAKRIIEEAQTEAASIIRSAQDKFSVEREHRVARSREQAKSILETSLVAAQTEAEQIASLTKEELKRIEQRFNDNADSIVEALLKETTDGILIGGA